MPENTPQAVTEVMPQAVTEDMPQAVPEDMPQATTISLSANDDLVPKGLIVAQLEASPLPVKVVVHPTAGHEG